MKPLKTAPLTSNTLRLSALVLALSLSTPSMASIASANGMDPDGINRFSRGNKPELMLVIWDATSGAQYTRDLGIWAAPLYPNSDWSGPRVNARDPFKNDADRYADNLYITGQQNTGKQIFIRDFEKDPNFQEFQKIAAGGSLFWGITTFGKTSNDLQESDLFVYTTLRSDANANGDYTKLKTLTNDAFIDGFGSAKAENWFNYLNMRVDKSGNFWSNPFNSHTPVDNSYDYGGIHGSSYDPKQSVLNIGSKPADGPAPMYADGGFLQVEAKYSFNFLNPLGSSSWFYQVTRSQAQDGPQAWYESEATVEVDEFDNLGHDAYWGLTKDEKGEFVLSYTMPGVLTPTVTAAGLQRRSFIDFSAGSGRAQLITARAGEFAGWKPSLDGFTPHAPIAAVPEPASWGLMGLGLAALIGARRRARRSA